MNRYIATACIKNYYDVLLGVQLADENNPYNIKLMPLSTLRRLIHERKIHVRAETEDNKFHECNTLYEILSIINDERKEFIYVNTFDLTATIKVRELLLSDGSVTFKRVKNLKNIVTKARALSSKFAEINEHLIAIADDSEDLTIMYDTDELYMISGASNQNLRLALLHESGKFRVIDLSNVNFELLSTIEALLRDVNADSIIFGEKDASNVLTMDYAFEYATIKNLDMLDVQFENLQPGKNVFASSIIKNRNIPSSMLNCLK